MKDKEQMDELNRQIKMGWERGRDWNRQQKFSANQQNTFYLPSPPSKHNDVRNI